MPTKHQVLGTFGEERVTRDCTCPKCKRTRTLVRLPPNFKCADIICDFCGYLAQVKATTAKDIGSIPDAIMGAAWGPQKERMDAAIYFPLFLVLVEPEYAELVVARLDRLGRDTRDVLNIIHECETRGAYVTVLDPLVSTRGDMGHVIITVLGMVAQMERRFIKERQREGIARAKVDGRYKGGKRRIDAVSVRQRHASGDSVAAIAVAFGCSRMQVYRILNTDSRHDDGRHWE